MAIKDIINAGIGFNIGTLAYVITRGLGMFLTISPAGIRLLLTREKKRYSLIQTKERMTLARNKKRHLLK